MLVVIGQDMMRFPFRQMCTGAHILVVIGQDVVRLPFRKCAMTHFLVVIGPDVMRLAFKDVQCCSHPGQGVMGLPFRQMCNGAHILVVIGQDVMRFPFRQKVQWYSHPFSHRTRGDQICLSDKCASQVNFVKEI